MTNIKKTEKGYDIELTKGDTLLLNIDPKINGEEYEPEEGDVFRFATKRKYSKEDPIVKDIPTDTMILCMQKEETKLLEVGEYDFDIEFTSAAGFRSTFIEGTLKILKEVC